MNPTTNIAANATNYQGILPRPESLWPVFEKAADYDTLHQMSSMPSDIGRYQLLREIGRGGMGVVYLGRDTVLDRDVAIKTLPDELAADPDRLARFQREAKALASLNHPNIASIYGVEEVDGKRYLILEFVEGETLSDILPRGPIPVDEALHLARQIAEGVEAAHEKGIIHRDLKPANIKLSGGGSDRVKILDFGLAKAIDPNTLMSADPTLSPTIVTLHSPTIPGVVLGTAGYLSPEQARGRPVDKRCDIWSFGCVLFEMLTGQQIFPGETVADSIGATLHKDPDWTKLPPNTPPTVQLLLRRCLTKDRKHRLQDIGDARIELENALVDPTSSMLGFARAALDSSRGRRSRLPWAAALIALPAVAIGAWLLKPNTNAPKPVIRLTMAMPVNQSLGNPWTPLFDVSPDGTRIVYRGDTESGTQLYLRHMNQLDAVPLANTSNAFNPIFSPDGQWIAFAQDGKMKKISILGGPATKICDAEQLRGGSWGSDGTIVFAPKPNGGIWRVSSDGGSPEQLTDLADEVTATHRWPQLLPDGKTVLFTARKRAASPNWDDANIIALSLDTKNEKVVIEGGTFARYVPTGHIVFGRLNTLMAVPFDIETLAATGPAVPILEGVLTGTTGCVQFGFSQSGTLVYLGGETVVQREILVWLDREGKETPASQHVREYGRARLSPDGSRIALGVFDGTQTDIWILELARDDLMRLTTDDTNDRDPVWSPDGKWIVFTSTRHGGPPNLYRCLADGTGEVERLSESENFQGEVSFAPDGSTLVFLEGNPVTGPDIHVLRLDGTERKSVPFLATPFIEHDPVISPDGRWIAYISNESGEHEVWVRRFPEGGSRVKVSTGTGDNSIWSPDGLEITYYDDDKIWSTPMTVAGEAIRAGTPVMIAELPKSYSWNFDISRDGKRLLFIRSQGDEDRRLGHPTVVINWFEEFRTRQRER